MPGLARLVIIGAGGQGREALDIVEAVNRVTPTFEFLGFLADDPGDPEILARRGVDVLGGESMLTDLGCGYLVAIGDPSTRRVVAHRVDGAGELVTLVHPVTNVDHDIALGAGVLVPAGAVVQEGVVLGDHVQLNVNASVGAGSHLERFATLSPGTVVGRDCRVGAGALLGTGAIVVDGVDIGAGAVVGAGARVEQPVAAGTTVRGRPAGQG